MCRIEYYISFLLLMVLSASCADDAIRMPEEVLQNTTIHLKAVSREAVATRSVNADAMIDPQSLYVLIFDGQEAESRLLDWTKVVQNLGGGYTAGLKKQNEACYACVIANATAEISGLATGWTTATTLKNIRESLRTNLLPQTLGVITAGPGRHPMYGEYALPDGITSAVTIGTAGFPVEMVRATAKVTVAYSGGAYFTLSGANLGAAPVRAFIFPDVTGTAGVETIATAHYGANGDISGMLAGMNPGNINETLPLYAYESPKTNATFVIIKGAYNGAEGYYRINLLTADKQELLPLRRNYYYRITITNVLKAGSATAREAIDNPAGNALQSTIEVVDPYSHEIITDGSHYLGVSNSEYWIYDNSMLNEFGKDDDYAPNKTYEEGVFPIVSGGVRYYLGGNGYLATILTYTTEEGWEPGKVTGDNGIRFRQGDTYNNDEATISTSWAAITPELTLAPATEGAVTRKIIINIPRDFKQGTVTIKIGPLEKKILIQRKDIISLMGEVLDMGTGYASGKMDVQTSFYSHNPSAGLPDLGGQRKEFVKLSTFKDFVNGSGESVYPGAGDHLYVHVKPDPTLDLYAHTMSLGGLCEFYLTRADKQQRVKVHLLREGYYDGIRDNPAISYWGRYVSAFWRNDQTGERIIRVKSKKVGWYARVVYGTEFIRLTPFHANERTPEELAATDAEDFQADATWSTSIQCLHDKNDSPGTTTNFRIALTSKNPRPEKPRYGMVIFTFPNTSTFGIGQTIRIFIRQGEEPDYIFSPQETYQGASRTYAQKFSPYTLTVPDPDAFQGGPNYTDYQHLNGVRPVFTDYPSQCGYLFQWGSDIPIHPENPLQNVAINGYTYDYNAVEKELCPDGYMLPITDAGNSAFDHSLRHTNKIFYTSSLCEGVCADGFFDRQPQEQGAYITKLGARCASKGFVYVNPETLANIFITEGRKRPDGKALADIWPGGTTTEYGMSWARYGTNAGTDANKQGTFVTGVEELSPSNRPVFTGMDRKSAFPIRCVKK